MKKRIKTELIHRMSLLTAILILFAVTDCAGNTDRLTKEKNSVAQEDAKGPAASLGDSDLNGLIQEEGTKQENPGVIAPDGSDTLPAETVMQASFDDTEETVYAVQRVNMRYEPSLQAEIFRTMNVGEQILRTGVSDQWSRVLYGDREYYVAAEYLSKEMPPAVTLADRVDQLLPGMNAAEESNQLVLAVGNDDRSDRCTVFYYTKDSDGGWNRRFETEGFWGFNGVKKVILEADGCTPEGCFPFRFAYGIQPDPGSVMEYKQATPTAYMVDDVNSRYYNLWVDTSDEGVEEDWKTAEHVIDFTTSYNYGLFIDNNPDCDTAQGSSVICLHCTSPRGFSPGCINIAEEYVLTLVRELDYSSRMVIVPGVEDLASY